MRTALPTRATALVVVAVFAFQLGRDCFVADLMNFVCPHHVPSAATEAASHGDHSASALDHSKHSEPQPAHRDSGLRCCCRHALDSLVTTLILDSPGEWAKAPLPEGTQSAPLSARIQFSENSPSPPFQPPRV